MALKVFAGSAMTLAETNHLEKLRERVNQTASATPHASVAGQLE